MIRPNLRLCLLSASSVLLAACGGGGGGDNPPVDPPAPAQAVNQFTQSARWTFTLPASGSICYDFDAQAEVPECSGNQWDIKVTSSGRTASLFTNSGVSGTGAGGAFGSPFMHTWAELQDWKSALVDPASNAAVPTSAYVADAAKNVFTGSNGIQSAAFEYDLNGTHQLSPNFRVFLITADSASASATGDAAAPVFALQVTGYYGGAGGATSGYPSFRWIDRADPTATVQTAQVDASAGWVYYDLVNQTTTPRTGPWHIAFNRYNILLNSAVWNLGGKAGGFVGATPAGFYAADGAPVVAQFNNTSNLTSTLADLTGELAAPASARAWVQDAIGSQLNPNYTGAYPNALNYGWYSYYPTDAVAATVGLSQHMLKANPDNATLVRSGEGNSYARMHLASISYAAATPAYSGEQTWTLEFGIQPAP